MKRIWHFSLKLTLCSLLACSLVVNASAEKAVSVFAATDRHAQYETVTVETEESEAARETPPPEASEKEPPKRQKSMPVYDANGFLIWHNHLTDVLTLVRQDRDAVQPDIVLLGGDNIGEGSDSSKDETWYPMGAPPFSMKAVDAQITHVFGDGARGLYTYGSHDKNETGNYTDVFFSGPVPYDGYYLYGISFAQMIYDSDYQARAEDERGRTYSGKDLADPNGISAQTASHLFLSWVKSLDDHWPIIVMSHVPLHAKRGDNSGAWTWARALNEAAESHDVIFLWGHNHTLERDEEDQAAEQANYLLLPGDEITVQSWALNAEGKPALRKSIPSEALTAGDAEAEEKPKYELITEKE
ncbi:MAG: metallophosphoesterase, partial [Clostridia bacterium]|nr:metallophosphoesterase [Clostridia bacterium]